MAITIKSLFNSPLSTTAKSMVYTVPAGKAAMVTAVRLANTDTSPKTVNLYYLKSGDSASLARSILPPNLGLAAAALFVDDAKLTMGTGDQILGDSTTALVDCVVSGFERDA